MNLFSYSTTQNGETLHKESIIMNKIRESLIEEIKYSYKIENEYHLLNWNEFERIYDIFQRYERYVNFERFEISIGNTNKDSKFWYDLIQKFWCELYHKKELENGENSWRTCNVRVGSHYPPQHQYISRNMERFCEEIVERNYDDKSIGYLHGRFESVHPFQDFNGRTGRFLIPLIHSYHGKEDGLFMSHYIWSTRQNYYDALSGFSFGNIDVIEDYFIKGLNDYFIY